MSFYVVVYKFYDDVDKVSRYRPAHREYLQKFDAQGELVLAGPMGEPGGKGGLLIFEAVSVDRVMTILDDDPYLLHEVVEEHSVHEWTPSFGADKLGLPIK